MGLPYGYEERTIIFGPAENALIKDKVAFPDTLLGAKEYLEWSRENVWPIFSIPKQAIVKSSKITRDGFESVTFLWPGKYAIRRAYRQRNRKLWRKT